MNTDTLVDAITAQVLVHLQAMGNATQSARKHILLLGDHLDYGWWEKKLGDTFEVYRTSDTHSSDSKHYDSVLITQLSNRLLDDLSQGVGRSQDSVLVIDCLLRGIPVYLLVEGIEYRAFKVTATPALFQRFQEKEHNLISYGVTVVTAADLLSAMMGFDTQCSQMAVAERDNPVYESNQPVGFETCVIEDRVVREAHLLEGMVKGYGRFLIRNDALITPLAQDCIRIKELDISKASDTHPSH